MLERFHAVVVEVWNGGEFPQEWENANRRSAPQQIGRIQLKQLQGNLTGFTQAGEGVF